MAQGNGHPPFETTVAALPSSLIRDNRLYLITDAAHRGDTTTGGGSVRGIIFYNGTAWEWLNFSAGKQSVTLGAAATALAIDSDFVEVTGDAGANTLATITGGWVGQRLVLLFVDALVTITDDNSHAADSVDLSAAFVSADDTTLELIYDGTSWYEISRSVN